MLLLFEHLQKTPAVCRPSVGSYNLAMLACLTSKQWDQGLEWLDTVKKWGIQPDAATYRYAISACV
jgi:pentatricopeptide repeat protein